MPESNSHKNAKNRAAGKSGRTEVPLSNSCRLDALAGSRATEVERSGNAQLLAKAARRLRSSHASQKVLQVPQHDMKKAAKAMREVGVHGTVKNMKGSKRKPV